MTQIASSPIPAEAAAVAEHPHWRFLLRPVVYDEHRIPTMNDCWRRVEDCQVRTHRGLTSYPELDRDPRYSAAGPGWVESWEPELSYWRLYQSGQFVHHLVLPGNADGDEAWRAERVARLQPPQPPTGLLEAYWALDSLRAFLTFAGRLATRIAGGERVQIEVALRGNAGILLFSDDLAWPPRHPGYVARHDLSIGPIQLGAEELLGTADDVAVDVAIQLFAHFGWEASPELLRRYIASRA
ncbi:MAG: hypothetical protein HY875_08650 [Chloroflexi bacterium]|nr:hypothetical protein [Chloroflexota bacterium]